MAVLICLVVERLMQADLDCEAVSFMIDEHSEEPRGGQL